MKVAFAGFGHVHIWDVYDHVRENEENQIAGVWESDENVRQMLEGKGIAVDYETYDALLEESGADIIAIGAPFADRGELIIKALQAGKHVVTDKPICTRRSELEEIERLVREKGLKIGCMLTMRYMGKIRAIRELIGSGAIGEIRTIYYGLQHPLFYGQRASWYFEKGRHGGVINDIAIHGIDAIRYLTGLRPEKVLSARSWNAFAPAETEFRDSAQFMAVLSNGAGLLADVSYSVPNSFSYEFPTHWEIFGTKGVIRFSWQDTPSLAYFDGQKEAVLIEPQPFEKTYWDDFLAEIRGGDNLWLTTEEVLTSAKDTMMIQERSI